MNREESGDLQEARAEVEDWLKSSAKGYSDKGKFKALARTLGTLSSDHPVFQAATRVYEHDPHTPLLLTETLGVAWAMTLELLFAGYMAANEDEFLLALGNRWTEVLSKMEQQNVKEDEQ